MTVITRDAYDYRQVEQALGVQFFDDPETAAIAADIQSPDALIIGNRSPARERIFTDAIAAQAGRSVDMDKLSSYLGMLKNLEAYIDSPEIDEELRDHQVTVFDDLYNFLNGTHATDESHSFSYSRRGYIEKPPSAGKTVEYVKLIEAVSNPMEGAPRPKSLVLVPGRATYDQTVGERGKRGFGLLREDTDLKVTGAGKDGYDTSGDIIVMTYAAFRRHEYQNMLAEAGVDIVVCDEAHKAIGPKTQEAIREFSQDKILLGFTATGEYGVNHHVRDLFENEVHKMGFNEAADIGIFQPVQAYLYETHVEVEPDFSSAKFTQKEYDRLIEAEGRTAEGVAFAREFVEQGVQGIISCLPGDNRAHAKKTAELLGQETVVTANSERKVRAAAIDGSLPRKEQRRLLKEYSEGKIDVLCYVDSLNEGWDEENARFLINLRPTDSEVLAKQRLGRILRRNNDQPPSIVVDFVDKTKKLQQTFLQIFDVEQFEQGRIFARGGISESELAGRAVILPDWMRDKIGRPDIRQLAERFFDETIRPAPEDYLSLREAAAELDRNYTDVYQAAGRLKLELERFIGSSNRITFHLSPDQIGYLREYFESGARPATDGSVPGVRVVTEPESSHSGHIEEAVRDSKRFRSLPEALDEGFRQQTNRYETDLAFESEVTRWKLVCRRGQDGMTYGSNNPATQGIHTLIELYDQATAGISHLEINSMVGFYGVYGDNRIRQLRLPGNDTAYRWGAASLFDSNKGYWDAAAQQWRRMLSDDVLASDASADEIVKIEALVNLGLSDGKPAISAAPEAIPYQNELAREMGQLCLRAVEELDLRDHAKEETKRVVIRTDGLSIWIGQKVVPAVDFPGATILERYVSLVDVIHETRDESGIGYKRLGGNEEHALLYDGSVAKVRIIGGDNGEESGFSGINSFTMMPTGYYSPVFEAPNEEALTAALGIIREKLGPDIDWGNIGLQTVLEAAQETLDLSPGVFSKTNMRSDHAQAEAARRGLAFMLAVDRRIASIPEIAEATGLSESAVLNNIKRTRDKLSDDRPFVGGRRLREEQTALIRSLPRVDA